jgi:hypothetical protein
MKFQLKITHNMILEILNKILTLFFFLACLTTFRHGYYFIQAYLSSTDEPVKYRLSNRALLLGISIAYLFTVIFTGVKL